MVKKQSLSEFDKAMLQILLRTRGMDVRTAQRYLAPGDTRSEDALRKNFERLRDSGYIAGSKLPSGRQMFRLSHKGVKLVGAPAAWAARLTASIAAEMISISAVAWNRDEFLFLTQAELSALLQELQPRCEVSRLPGRFLLRSAKDSETESNTFRLNYWMCEIRPAESLRRRVQVVAENLARNAVFAELMSTRQFGMSIAVPSLGVKASLEQGDFPVDSEVLVVEELQELAR